MSHNLDIQNYSFYELLDLFDLDHNEVSLVDLKRAKKLVLMLHPDKSKLGPEYFLFYKKAFEIVVRMYDNVQKVSQRVEDTEYVAETSSIDSKQFNKNINDIPKETFQKNFNEMFEKHMKTPVNTGINDWFTQEDALYNQQAANPSQMGVALEQIKNKQQNLVKYNGIVPMYSQKGNSFYDDEEDDGYVCSDPFSKLKFDDLRKVHKDQTVFSVKDSDLQNVARYRSVDDYERARDVRQIKPMERSKAQVMMEEQEKMLQEKMRQKQYASELNTMKHVEANKQVMANFLRLT
jgi:hypothetical protein